MVVSESGADLRAVSQAKVALKRNIFFQYHNRRRTHGFASIFF